MVDKGKTGTASKARTGASSGTTVESRETQHYFSRENSLKQSCVCLKLRACRKPFRFGHILE